MKVKMIQFKNFLSYGKNEITTLDITDLSTITIIKGENGAGKSTIMKALIWGIYGKLEGLSNKELGNSFYPKAEVYVNVEVNSSDIKIIRRLSPSKLEVIIDGKALDLPSKIKTQEKLEELIKIPYSIFSNYIAINSLNFKSILSMTPSDRKATFEKILGFDELNNFKEFVLKKYSNFLTDFNLLKEEIIFNEEQVKSIKSLISSINIKLQKINNFSESDEERLKTLKEQILNKQKEIETITPKISLLSEKNSEIQYKINELEKRQADITNKVCPTCSRPFDDNMTKEIIKDKLKEIKKSKEDLLEKLKTGREFKSQFETRILSLKNNSNIDKEIKMLLRKKEESLISEVALKGELKAHNDTLIKLNDNLKKLKKQFDSFSVIDENYKKIKGFLGDKGFKKKLILDILPLLNNLVQKYKDYFELDFAFSFNEELKCDIIRGSSILNGKTLSKGESEKADLIIILSLIELIKNNSPKINLLFFDEMFGGLSPSSEEQAIKLVEEVSHKLGLKSLIVTHHELSLIHI